MDSQPLSLLVAACSVSEQQMSGKKINKKVGHGNPLFNRIVASISLVADDSMENEIKQFFRKNPTPGTERTQAQTLERIRINSKFLRRMKKEFKDG